MTLEAMASNAVWSVPQGSRSFRREADLVDTLSGSAYAFVDSATQIVLSHEVRVGAGSVDLMFGIPDPTLLRSRLQSNVRLSAAHIVLLLALEAVVPRTLTQLCHRTRIAERKAERLLSDLLQTRFASECGEGVRFVRTENSRPYFRAIVSVEAKLRKWSVALRQATRNRLFSNCSFVALDVTHSRPAEEHLHLFAQAEVGLATVGAADASVAMSWRPPPGEPSSQLYYWEAMEALAQKLADGEAQTIENLNAF